MQATMAPATISTDGNTTTNNAAPAPSPPKPQPPSTESAQELDLFAYLISWVYFSSATSEAEAETEDCSGHECDSASGSWSTSCGSSRCSSISQEDEEEDIEAGLGGGQRHNHEPETEVDAAFHQWRRRELEDLFINQERLKGLRLIGPDGLAMPFNASRPVPFVTPTFRGSLLFLVNAGGEEDDNDHHHDPYKPYLDHRKYRFEMRIQGSFTSKPQGVLMMGAELPHHLHLSLFTRPIANMCCVLGSSMVQGLHYSFGEGNVSKPIQHQAAHCTWPVATGMDRIGKCVCVACVWLSPQSLYVFIYPHRRSHTHTQIPTKTHSRYPTGRDTTIPSRPCPGEQRRQSRPTFAALGLQQPFFSLCRRSYLYFFLCHLLT